MEEVFKKTKIYRRTKLWEKSSDIIKPGRIDARCRIRNVIKIHAVQPSSGTIGYGVLISDTGPVFVSAHSYSLGERRTCVTP